VVEVTTPAPGGDAPPDSGPWWGWLIVLPVSALFVIGAVALEITGGANANSPVPSWAHLVPLAWPQWVRVLWWLGVATAAGTFRRGLRRVGMPGRRVVDVVAVLPFVAFAAGIAFGAAWATWH